MSFVTLYNILLFFANILLWVSTYLYFKKKYGKNSIGSIMILLYTTIAILGPYIFMIEDGKNFFINNLTILPFIYLYLMLIVAIRPLFNYSPKYIQYLSLPRPQILNLICLTFSLISIISLIKIIPSLKEGIIGLIIDSSSAADIYSKSTYSRMNQTNNIGYDYIAIFSNISVAIIPFLFFCYLLQKKKKKVIMTLLTISILIPPLNGIANASRLNIISSFLTCIFLGLFFYPYFNHSIKINLKKGAIFVSIFFSIIFILITIGRSSQNNSTSIGYGLMRYFAEGPLVFNNYCLDANGTRDGEYTFAFQHILDRGSQPNEAELRERYSNLKINSSRFYTFVGDFVLDYGPIPAFIIIVAIFFIVYNKTIIHRKTMLFPQMILLYILIQYCCGFYQYQYSMKMGNAYLVALILFYISMNLSLKYKPGWFITIRN